MLKLITFAISVAFWGRAVCAGDVEFKAEFVASSSHPSYSIEVFSSRGGVGYWLDNTKGRYPDWVEARFDEPRIINKVVVVSGDKDYDVLMFDIDEKCWRNVKNTRIDLAIEDIYHFYPVRTDAVRFAVNMGIGVENYSNLSKFKVFKTDDAPSEKFAAGEKVDAPVIIEYYEASSSHSAQNIENFPERHWVDGTPWIFPDYLTAVLERKVYFNKVILSYPPDGPPENMEIQAMVNGKWHIMAATDKDNLAKEEFCFPAIEANAVRLLIRKGAKPYKYSSIAKFEVWCKK